MKHAVAFLLDADNTLLDNDRILADLMGHIEQTVGHQGKQRYWAIFEELREELGYARLPGSPARLSQPISARAAPDVDCLLYPQLSLRRSSLPPLAGGGAATSSNGARW